MTTLESATLVPALIDEIRDKLRNAPAPLKLAEIARGLKKSRSETAAEFEARVRLQLDEEIRLGRMFVYPSGKEGMNRYWSKDEKLVLRDRAAQLAAAPLRLAALQSKLAREIKGTEPAFVERLIGEWIRDKQLFEHPAKSKTSPALIGARPAPSPLEQARHKRTMERLTRECRKVLAAANVQAEELLTILRQRLAEPAPAALVESATAARQHPGEARMAPAAAPQTPRTDLEELILKAVANTPVVTLAELRRELPHEYRGARFDEAVLRLAQDGRVILGQDNDPAARGGR